MTNVEIKKYVAEAVGTAILTLVVALSLAGKFSVPTSILAGSVLALFVYTVGQISGAHINPAITMPAVLPKTAPEVPNPKMTSAIIMAVFIADWQISIVLLSSIFSMPVNAAVAALISPLARIEIDAIWINEVISGR